MNDSPAPATPFDAQAYLRRIGLKSSPHADFAGLQALFHAQLRAIPFENFDVLLGRPIALHPAAIFAKLVHRRRGGYCFELNGLFLHALHAFGFSARPLLARVCRDGIPLGRGHQISLVTLGATRWLLDVGFGAPHLPGPMPLTLHHPFGAAHERFRLTAAPPYGIMLQQEKAEAWNDLYCFDLGHVCDGDIAYANHYTSTHPASFFTTHRVAALATETGRVSLLDTTLRRITREGEELVEVAEGEDYLETLRRLFAIDLGEDGHRLPALAAAARKP